MNAIFLDRDGTLVKDYLDEEWKGVEKLELFPDTISALSHLQHRFMLFIVSNQYLIQEGYISSQRFMYVHRKFIRELTKQGVRIEQTYFCPHPRSMNCGCRKPGRGMIDQCIVNYEIDLSHSWVIGNSDADIGLGKLIGCKTIGVRDFKGKLKPTYKAPNLTVATDFIDAA